MNNYYFRARLFPTVLTSIPMFVFINSIVIKNYEKELSAVMQILPILSSLGISLALVFLLTQINRVLSKEIFQRFFFEDEIHMPSTDYLLWSDPFFERHIKEQLHLKIEDKFGVKLMTQQEEQQDEVSHRKRIVVAVSQIRNSLRSNNLLFQHNIEYGFFRNLLGGCLIALLFTAVILIHSYLDGDKSLVMIGLTFLFVYSIPLLLSKKILSVFGRNYAKILFEQFFSVN